MGVEIGDYCWVLHTINSVVTYFFCRVDQFVDFGSRAKLTVLNRPPEFTLYKDVLADQIPNSAPATEAHLLSHRLQGGKL
jgi:hypothetical protein